MNDDFIKSHGGYIGLFRSIRDDPVYRSKPFSKGQAWVDLLMLANYATAEEFYGMDFITYERGKIYRSMSWLAEEWGWDRRKVKRFLTALEKDGRLTVEVLKGGTTNGCVITIENYEKFQGRVKHNGTTHGTTDRSTGSTTSGSQIKRNKKELKKEEKKDFNSDNVIPMPEEVRQKWKKFMEG